MILPMEFPVTWGNTLHPVRCSQLWRKNMNLMVRLPALPSLQIHPWRLLRLLRFYYHVAHPKSTNFQSFSTSTWLKICWQLTKSWEGHKESSSEKASGWALRTSHASRTMLQYTWHFITCLCDPKVSSFTSTLRTLSSLVQQTYIIKYSYILIRSTRIINIYAELKAWLQ